MNYGFPDDDDYDNDYDDDDMNNRNNNNNNIIIRNDNNPTTTNNDINNDDDDNNDDSDVPVHLKNYDGYLKDIIIDNDAIDEAPKMPLDYYNSIDNFLKQGPPKIKTKNNNNNTTNEKTNSNKINTNSNKNKAKEPKMRVLPPAPVVPVAMSKIDCGGKDTKGKKKKIDIDHNLLLAAFSYVDQISREVNDDDDDAVLKEFNTNTNNRNRNMWPSNNNDNNNNNNNNVSSSSSMKQPRSAPVAPNVYYDTTAPKKKGSKKNSNNSIVKKLRSQTATANMNTFEISSAIDNNDDRRNALDFDALVSNFEQGLTIKKLKADLQDSKQAMANSLAFMKQIKSEMRF